MVHTKSREPDNCPALVFFWGGSKLMRYQAGMTDGTGKLKSALGGEVSAFMAANNVAGCSVAIAYPNPAGAQLATQLFSYGLASKATQQPVTPVTEFEIGSLSKLFTADLLAVFVGQGQMA